MTDEVRASLDGPNVWLRGWLRNYIKSQVGKDVSKGMEALGYQQA